MKMTKMFALILCLALGMSLLTGCDLFAPATEGTPGGPTPSGNTDDTSIKFTDDYTITDPEDLDFDTRVVLYGDVSNPTLQMYVSMGITINEAYIVIYGKEGKPVAEYDYYLFADEASATAFGGMAPGMEMSGLVGKLMQGKDAIDSTSAMMQAQGLMADDSFESYVNMYKTAYGYTEK